MGIYVGFDIGGTKCAAITGIEKDGELTILGREAFATPADQQEALDRLCALAKKLAGGQEILGIGISSGGPMDADKGELCANGNAGELGHWRLAETGPAGYGKVGAFEGFCSGGGIAQLAQSIGTAWAQRGQKPAWLSDRVTAKDVAQAAFAGDPAAQEVFDTSARFLGKGLALAVDFLNPDCIVIGSVYARSEALFQKELCRALEADALAASLAVCRIVPARLGDSIGDCAALSLAVQAAGAQG